MKRVVPASVTFLSTNSPGGSEVLWTACAFSLCQRGHRVSVGTLAHLLDAPHIRALAEQGVNTYAIDRFPGGRPLHRGIYVAKKLRGANRQIMARMAINELRQLEQPDLFVVSKGYFPQSLEFLEALASEEIPYLIIDHLVSELQWLPSELLATARSSYGRALRTCFVSEANRVLAERQLGMDLPSATLVRNPVNLAELPDAPLPLPQGDPIRLACVGNLCLFHKGQDLLLSVLAQPHWRQRPIELSFAGLGADEAGLRATVAYMGLDNVHFLGHVNDMRALWEQHHALLMASRMEAGPMVVVEANLCGRLAIGPNLGAFPELIEDGVTGFLAESASQPALERAMETFLSMRPDWPEISARAFIRGKEYLRGKEYQDQSPSEAFAELILACLG